MGLSKPARVLSCDDEKYFKVMECRLSSKSEVCGNSWQQQWNYSLIWMEQSGIATLGGSVLKTTTRIWQRRSCVGVYPIGGYYIHACCGGRKLLSGWHSNTPWAIQVVVFGLSGLSHNIPDFTARINLLSCSFCTSGYLILVAMCQSLFWCIRLFPAHPETRSG